MAGLFSSVEDLVAVLERPKVIVGRAQWTEPNAKHGERRIRIKYSLSNSSAVIPGVGLVIECNQEGFELPMAILLLAEVKGKPRAFARIDINGSKHENRYKICGDLQHTDAGGTHFHDTRLHLGLNIDELFNGLWDLPIARPISDMPENFGDVILDKPRQLAYFPCIE